MNKDVLFAKQPILDANNNLYGYEILYRDSELNQANITDGKKATTELLINYCSGLVDETTGPYVKIFINLNRGLILSDCFFPLPPNRLVIEILEDIEIDVDLLVKISELKSRGYSFAIDDYKFEKKFDDLLVLVDFIKIDILDMEPSEISNNYKQLKERGLLNQKNKPIILAEKVETEEVYNICKTLGFSLFQGYYLARPTMVFGKKLVASSNNALRLMAALQQQDITMEAVSELISQDVQQSYLILKIVNSPICHFPRKIESIHEGIVYLGLKQIKQWAMVLALTGNSNTPIELFRMLLERAKTCEIYAQITNSPNIEKCFTAGLFSGLDLVLKADKSWLLEQVGISADITEAILNYQGTIGRILDITLKLEQGNLEELQTLKKDHKDALMEANLEATKWVTELFPMIKNSSL